MESERKGLIRIGRSEHVLDVIFNGRTEPLFQGISWSEDEETMILNFNATHSCSLRGKHTTEHAKTSSLVRSQGSTPQSMQRQVVREAYLGKEEPAYEGTITSSQAGRVVRGQARELKADLAVFHDVEWAGSVLRYRQTGRTE